MSDQHIGALPLPLATTTIDLARHEQECAGVLDPIGKLQQRSLPIRGEQDQPSAQEHGSQSGGEIRGEEGLRGDIGRKH